MKSLLIALVATGVIGGIVFFSQPEKVSYVAPMIMATSTPELPDWASDEDAVVAAKDVIRKKELEARLVELNSGIDSLLEEKKEVEKELGTF